MERVEAQVGSHVMALDKLGPSDLSKLLYEAHLIALRYRRLDDIVGEEPAGRSR